ncbi:MAG: molybdopterin converting factor subunit 1 [Comamonadaceae bacterium]|nr:MAG: molybdopterin converting factor subunit 1 [Comamonadaceae bacterium]
MKIRLRYFASVRESLGRSAEEIETDAPTVGAVRDELIARGGPYATALVRERAVRIALDHVMTDEEAPVHEDCEVAFFPPVTGG